MVKFINTKLGIPFWVAENRVEEYKEAGYKPASSYNAVKPEMGKDEAKEEVTRSKSNKKSTPKNEEDVWLTQR